jgi:MFS-type transporter involved in bile tolerance (Atg22 family)
MTAIWFAFLVLPLMLFTPDRPVMMPMRKAVRPQALPICAPGWQR